MNAAEILASRGRAIPAHPITIRIVDPTDVTRIADAPACLVFVPDRVRLDAADAAAESLSKSKTPPSLDRRATEEAYYFLASAVRQEGAPTLPMFDTAIQVKSMLTTDEVVRIQNEYDRYVSTNSLNTLTVEQIAKIREDVKQYFLGDLLRQHGYWNVLRLLPSLAIEAGASLTPMSSSSA